ncbi:MAG: hypothetical protein M3N26_06820 [Pseudomonadota bacterium]|nr:hypothetical protein [Pseudomonadota bacterium]
MEDQAHPEGEALLDLMQNRARSIASRWIDHLTDEAQEEAKDWGDAGDLFEMTVMMEAVRAAIMMAVGAASDDAFKSNPPPLQTVIDTAVKDGRAALETQH